jgi:hypothetical protein
VSEIALIFPGQTGYSFVDIPPVASVAGREAALHGRLLHLESGI